MGNYHCVNLILTRACNLNCSYCIQKDVVTKFTNQLPPSDLVKLIPNSGMVNVILYGGEPLLEFPYIKDLVPELKKWCPSATISITTNGTLLTEEIVNFFNTYGVFVRISHDGIKTKESRGYDVLETKGDLIATIKNLGFLTVITADNYNYFDIWDYFDAFSKKHNIPAPHVKLMCLKDVHGNTSVEKFLYNNDEFENMLDDVFALLKQDILSGNSNSYLVRNYDHWFGAANARLFCATEVVPCFSSGSNFGLDIEGKIYKCHNSGFQAPELKLPSKCAECSYYAYCGGICPLADPSRYELVCYHRRQEAKRIKLLLEDLITIYNTGENYDY